MGSVGGLLGVAGGANGTGFAGPQSANIQTPTTDKQAQDAYTANQNALAQQQSFMTALQGQNGIQNQNNVYSQLQGVANGTGPNPAQAQLAQATGANVANQAALMAGQRGSSQNAGMIARQAAQQGANTQQQSAGQAASLQAQQSLNAISAQGNIAGQQVSNLQNATAQNTQAQQSEQQNLLNAIAGQNNAAVSQQSNINQANASLAQSTMQGQQQMMGNMMTAGGATSNLAEGGIVGSDSPDVSGTGTTLPPVSNTGAIGGDGGKKGGGLLALLAQGGMPRKMYANSPDLVSADYDNHDNAFPQLQQPQIGQSASMQIIAAPQLMSQLPMPAGVIQPTAQQPGAATKGPTSRVANHFAGNKQPPPSQPGAASSQPPLTGAAAIGQGLGKAINWGYHQLFDKAPDATAQDQAPSKAEVNMQDDLLQHDSYTGKSLPAQAGDNTDATPDGQSMAARGGRVPALVSPGERYLPPQAVAQVLKGKDPMKAGEKIGGTPKVGGAKNSYANDTVPKTLEEGGVVLPRTVTKSKAPSEAGRRFVEAIAKKHGMKVR